MRVEEGDDGAGGGTHGGTDGVGEVMAWSTEGAEVDERRAIRAFCAGNLRESARAAESALVAKATAMDPSSPGVCGLTEALLKLYNMMALSGLREGNLTGCLDVLRKAEYLCARYASATLPEAEACERTRLHVVTLNNLGCCLARMGRRRAALTCCDEAIRASHALDGPGSQAARLELAAGAHLNMSATLCQLGQYQMGLSHATAAKENVEEALSLQPAPDDAWGDGAARLGGLKLIALYNMAVEFQHMGVGLRRRRPCSPRPATEDCLSQVY